MAKTATCLALILSLIFGITLSVNEKTSPGCSLYKVWNTIDIAEALIFVLKSTVTNFISGTKQKYTRAKQCFKLQKHWDHFIIMVDKVSFDSSFGVFIEISSFCVCVGLGFFLICTVYVSIIWITLI